MAETISIQEDQLPIKPGETTVIKTMLGQEQDEVQEVLESKKRVEELKETYSTMERNQLENKYKEIYSNFDLALRQEEDLQAMLGVLVEKFGLSDEDVAKLRK